MQFIRTILFAIKKRYGYYAQELSDSQVQALSKNIPNKQSDEAVPIVLQFEGQTYWFPNKEKLKNNVPTGDTSLERCIQAYVEEEKAGERNTTKRKKRTVKRKTDGKVRTLRKQKEN